MSESSNSSATSIDQSRGPSSPAIGMRTLAVMMLGFFAWMCIALIAAFSDKITWPIADALIAGPAIMMGVLYGFGAYDLHVMKSKWAKTYSASSVVNITVGLVYLLFALKLS